MGGLPTDRTVYAVVAHPRKPNVIFAALREAIYRSQDAGLTWTPLKTGPLRVVALAMHPEQVNVLYAATGAGVLYRSENSGESWEQRTEALRSMGR